MSNLDDPKLLMKINKRDNTSQVLEMEEDELRLVIERLKEVYNKIKV